MLNIKGEQFLADNFLKQNFTRLKNWSVGDIRKSIGNNANIGASILWICAIDFFGGLLTGCYGPGETERRIAEFVNKYLQKYGKYNQKKLYDLRWSLVHFYTVRHFTLDEREITKKYHLKKIKNRDCLLNLIKMIEDLENAVNDYERDLWKKSELRIKAFRYFKETKPLMIIENSKLEFLDEDCDL